MVCWGEEELLCQSISGKGDLREAVASHFRSEVRSQSSWPFFSEKLHAGPIRKICLTYKVVSYTSLKLPVGRCSQSVAPGLLGQGGGRSILSPFHVSAGTALWVTQNPCLEQVVKTQEASGANISGVPQVKDGSSSGQRWYWQSCNSGTCVRQVCWSTTSRVSLKMGFITWKYKRRMFREMSGPTSQAWETHMFLLTAGLWKRPRLVLNPQSLEKWVFLAQAKKKPLFSAQVQCQALVSLKTMTLKCLLQNKVLIWTDWSIWLCTENNVKN